MAKLTIKNNDKKLSSIKGNRIKDSIQKRRTLPYWLDIVIAILVWVVLYITLKLNWNPFFKRLIMVVSIIFAYYSVRIANSIARKIIPELDVKKEKQIFYILENSAQQKEKELGKGMAK